MGAAGLDAAGLQLTCTMIAVISSDLYARMSLHTYEGRLCA